MSAIFDIPFPMNWNAQDLADAVPLRLFELCDFLAEPGQPACANASRWAQRAASYLPANTMPARFRVHG